MKRILPPTLFYISVILMISLKWLFPITELISFPYNLFGIIFLLNGLIMSAWGSNKFKKVGTNIKTFNKPDKLVMDGMFRFSRNPMYLGFVLALLGISIILGTFSSLVITLIFFLITDRWYIQFEENVMKQKFGINYEEYKSLTRRWI